MPKSNLIWYSQVHANTGTSSFCRNQCLSLAKTNTFDIQIKPDPFVPTKLDNPILQSMLSRFLSITDSILMQVMWPERWYATIAQHPKFFIGYNAIEGTKIPYNWTTIMNDDDVDLVITMSKAMKNMFIKNGVKSDKLFPLGHGFNPSVFYPDTTKRHTLRNNKAFTFLYLNGWRTSIGRMDRKGPEILLDAWVKGKFVNNPKYHLYMKVNMVYEQPRDYFADIQKHLGYDVSKWTNFTFDINDYPETMLNSIYNNADCFISPTKGEGWGITIMEAMACGLPCIVPRNGWSGHMDFCDDSNSFLIDIDREEEVDSRLMGHLYSGSKWHIPSTEDLISNMHLVYNHQEHAKKIGIVASNMMKKYWTWDEASERMIKEFKQRGFLNEQ